MFTWTGELAKFLCLGGRTKQAYSESKGTRNHIIVNACVSAITTTQFLHLPIPLVHMLVKVQTQHFIQYLKVVVLIQSSFMAF